MKIWELMRLINDKPLMAEVMFHNGELWYENPLTKGWVKMERHLKTIEHSTVDLTHVGGLVQ